MILVTGDVVLDHNIYSGGRVSPDSPETTGMGYIPVLGGANLTFNLLSQMSVEFTRAEKKRVEDGKTAVKNAMAIIRALRKSGRGKGPRPPIPQPPAPAAPPVLIRFGLKETTVNNLHGWPSDFHAGAVWSPLPGPADASGKTPLHWRLSRNLGFGARTHAAFPGHATDLDSELPRVLVIDDGGVAFRHTTAEHTWPPFLKNRAKGGNAPWILLKMSRPLGRGDLWRALIENWRDRLIVLIGGDNLRSEDVRLSKGFSWESTVNHIVDEINDNPLLQGLNTCRHLVVALRGDAALWRVKSDNLHTEACCRLVFDAERAEGEWEESQKDDNSLAFLSAVSASLAWHIAGKPESDLNLVPALKAGLSAVRFLRQYGHGPVKGEETADPAPSPGFPFVPASKHLLKPTEKYSEAPVRCPQNICTTNEPWTILGNVVQPTFHSHPMFGPARRVALFGPAALNNVPCARFGKLLTMDCAEIESLRTIRRLMVSYDKKGSWKQPLSVAVFGAPGSGKSFGLKELAESVFGERACVLEFNLSQFTDHHDLIPAYHQVRDKALAGLTSIVFWDEFDSNANYWLQYLLAPMQDGKFLEGQTPHSIGKCIFVFAGGTSREFSHFTPEKDSEAYARFREKKGPDFVSRLAGYLNILGPNRRSKYSEEAARQNKDPWAKEDPSDTAYPIRRALLLRSLLGLMKDKKKRDRENEKLEIDRGLLTALLQTSRYLNGSRSVEKLVNVLQERAEGRLRRADLPPDEVLGLYVENVTEFHEHIREYNQFYGQAEKLAPEIHEFWRKAAGANPNQKRWKELSSEIKLSNVEAARRIPEILALAGLALIDAGHEGAHAGLSAEEVRAILEADIEFYAEQEHDGWMIQKIQEGFRYGEVRDDARRIHHLLKPYVDLPDHEKEKDRSTVRRYPDFAALVNFRIAARTTTQALQDRLPGVSMTSTASPRSGRANSKKRDRR